MLTTFLCLTIPAALLQAAAIGGNDASNNIGPGISSRAFSLRFGLLWGSMFEIIGALLLGSGVTITFTSKLIPVARFEGLAGAANIYALGMFCSLAAAMIYTALATRVGLPISTTHSIIGAICGFGFTAFGSHAVPGLVFARTFTAMLTSPLIGLVVTAVAVRLLKNTMLKKQGDSLADALHAVSYLPVLWGATSAIVSFLVLLKFSPAWWYVGLASIGIGLLVALGVWAVALPRIRLRLHNHPSNVGVEAELHHIHAQVPSISADPPNDPNSYSTEEDEAGSAASRCSGHPSLPPVPRLALAFDERVLAVVDDVQGLFVPLLWLASALMSFGHGANDIANASGPFAGVYLAFKEKQVVSMTSVPWWILASCALALSLGIQFLAPRVIKTVSSIVQLSPASAFASQFVTSLIVLVASILGLPVSGTHIIIGALWGVAWAEGAPIDPKLVKSIALSWIITFPAAMGISALLFFVLRAAIL